MIAQEIEEALKDLDVARTRAVLAVTGDKHLTLRLLLVGNSAATTRTPSPPVIPALVIRETDKKLGGMYHSPLKGVQQGQAGISANAWSALLHHIARRELGGG